MNIYTRLVILDSLRSFFLSALIPITEVVLMLVFIHELNASTWEKTLLGVLLKSGFVLSVPLSLWIFKRQFLLPQIIVTINLIGMLALLASILWQNVFFLLILVCILAFPYDGIHPLMAEFYSRYPKSSRGRRFAVTGLAITLGTILFAYIFRALYHADIAMFGVLSGYQWIVLITLAAMSIATLFSARLPRLKSKSNRKRLHLREVFNILKQDRLFLLILSSWMFLGIANLWILPYRPNYLSEESFGFAYQETRVIFLLVILPQLVQLIMTIPMSYVFDKIPFLLLRIFINVLFFGYLSLFFFGTSYLSLVLSMILYGCARAGGTIVWKLWVNQMVPVAKVGTYMAIHSGFTGIRMLLAPLFGLWGLYVWGPVVCGIISLALVVISIVTLLPLLNQSRERWKY